MKDSDRQKKFNPPAATAADLQRLFRAVSSAPDPETEEGAYIMGTLSEEESRKFEEEMAGVPYYEADIRVRRQRMANSPPAPEPPVPPTPGLTKAMRGFALSLAGCFGSDAEATGIHGEEEWAFAGSGSGSVGMRHALPETACPVSKLSDGTLRAEFITLDEKNRGVRVTFFVEGTNWHRESIFKPHQTGALAATIDISPAEAVEHSLGRGTLRVRALDQSESSAALSAPVAPDDLASLHGDPAPAAAWTNSGPKVPARAPVPASSFGAGRGTASRSHVSARLPNMDVEIYGGPGGSLRIEVRAERREAFREIRDRGGVQIERRGVPVVSMKGQMKEEGHGWVYSLEVPAHESPPEVVIIAGSRIPLLA